MHTRSKGVGGLQPLDLEIERGAKQRRREHRAILQQQRLVMESTSQGVTRDTPEQEGEHHVLNPQNDQRRTPVQNDYQQVPIEEHDHIPPQVPSPRHQGMPQHGYQPPHGDPPLVDAPQRNPPYAPPPYHHPYPPHPPYHYGYYYPPGPPPQPQVPQAQMPPPRVVEKRLDEVLKDKEPNEDKLVENQDFEGSGSQKGGDDKKKEVLANLSNIGGDVFV
nr:hypothetical protein Iba_chr08fCG0850 [Ipomoea batatas]